MQHRNRQTLGAAVARRLVSEPRAQDEVAIAR